jgi:hypothetical protein
MRLRKLTKMRTANDGTRSLVESIMAPAVIAALQDWTKRTSLNAVLIDDLALCYHAKPRMTQGICFLFKTPDDIPDTIAGFTRIRSNTFRHNKTGVDVEAVTPASINAPMDVVDRVFATATESDGVRIATASGLVALKLCRVRLKMRDRADIVDLVKTGKVDLTDFRLGPDRLRAFEELVQAAKTESG